ncbi:MAG: hypothetical protein Q8Q95_04495 [bacterium]|nr:hypothetical protein [bacterium]
MPLSIKVEAELKIGVLDGVFILEGFIFRSKDEQGNKVLEDISTGEVKGLSLAVVSKVRAVFKGSVERNVEKKGKGRKKERSVEQVSEYHVRTVLNETNSTEAPPQ